MAGCNLAHDIKHGNRTEWNFGDSKFPQYKDSRTTRRCLRPEPFSDKPPTKTHPALKLSPTVNGLKAATRSRSDSLEYCASSTTARRMLGKFLCAIGCWLKRWWMPKHSIHLYLSMLLLLSCLLLYTLTIHRVTSSSLSSSAISFSLAFVNNCISGSCSAPTTILLFHDRSVQNGIYLNARHHIEFSIHDHPASELS